MHNILLSFGLIILTGVAFRRLRIGGLDADSLRHAINITVLNIFLPALCINIIYTSKIDMEMLLVPATAWITIISTLLISFSVYTFLGRKMHIRRSEKGVLILSAAFGNVSYLGLPVLTGLYGYEAAKYALFYDLLASTPLLWLVGAPMASRYGENKKLKVRDYHFFAANMGNICRHCAECNQYPASCLCTESTGHVWRPCSSFDDFQYWACPHTS
ncbi:MAG: AEC family transporter [Nitrospirae bacterium]|nr:AEC family transporter [Nitrospirota bacterium]